MVKKISFSPEANQRLYEIVTYLVDNWSVKSAEKFLEILDNKLSHIRLFPYSFPQLENKEEVRKCVLTVQITLYYRLLNDEAELITFFDTRQDLEKLNL